MSNVLKLINNDPPGGRCKNNIDAAKAAARSYSLEIEMIPKTEAGPDAKVPAVYLNGKALAEIDGLRDGKITFEELVKELDEANVPKKSISRSSCSVFLDD